MGEVYRAHRSGIVHRDLKPGNVMLTKTGAKLMDFGLARGAGPAAGPIGAALSQTPTVHQPLTAEGTLIGTFQYMAPEQLEGRDADARTDLFAFGATLFEPPAITSVAPMLPPALERLVRACLAKEPDERIQTAHDVKLQLQWIRDAGSQSRVCPPIITGRSTEASRKNVSMPAPFSSSNHWFPGGGSPCSGLLRWRRTAGTPRRP